jgi:tetratricopeptide (TPR) repeat protein
MKAARLPLCVGAALLLSCASSPGAYRHIDAGVGAGDFDRALAALESGRQEEALYAPGDAILLHLDRGILAHYAGRYGESAADLEMAEELIRAAYTKSISQGIASYILNDNVRDYAGEDYEDLYINVFAALDYYHRGDSQGALVEIRKLTEKLDFLATKYARDAARIEEYARSQVEGVTLPAVPPPVNLADSVLARYLSGIFYRGMGLRDDARVDFARLADVWAASRSIYSGPLPEDLALSGPPGGEANAELYIPPGQARLNVVGFTGLGPVKVEEQVQVFFPFRHVPDGTISIPALRERPSTISGVEVSVEGPGYSGSVRLYALENMGAVMTAAFSKRYTLTLIKTFVRTVIKYVAAEAAGRSAAERSGSGLVGFLAARTVKAAADATERADTRSSRYLPSLAWAGGINLPPGDYAVTVRFLAGSRVAHTQTYASVPVSPGRTNLIEAVSLR